MKKFPRHAACCYGALILGLVVAFDLLLVRAVVIESDFDNARYCSFAADPGCQ